ncbi:MAG: hypothetical protein WAV89_01835 [Ignavibacteriaceae bacterium]
MGKSVLLITIGLSMIIGFFILKLNANSKEGLSVTVHQFETTQARLISNSGIETYLEKMRRNKTLSGSFLDRPLFGGSYDIHISGPDSALIITSVGKFDTVTHVSIVNAIRSKVEIPPVYGSLFVSSSNLSLNLNGNLLIDGNDHNVNETTASGSGLSVPGISVDSPNDSAFVVNDLKPNIEKDILGLGGTPSVRTVNDLLDWNEVTQNLIFAADITVPGDTYNDPMTFGTPTSPKITYVTGNVNLTGRCDGDGIMIVNGNLSMEGQFTYRGLIIVYGQSTIDTKVSGNGGIWGSLILVGQSVSIQATGNSSFYYSAQAIQNAQDNLKSSRFQILRWWE